MRLRIVQPLIPLYREPFFRALAARSDIELEVWADLRPNRSSIRCARPDGTYRTVDAPYREIGPFIWQAGALRAVNRAEADAVVMPWNTRYVHLVPALLRGRSRGVRTVLWGHGVGKRGGAVRSRIRNAAVRLADACLVYAPSVARSLVAEGVDASRVHVAPNSVDTAPIRAAESLWSDERMDAHLAQHGLERGRFALYVARLEPSKRPDVLVGAMAQLKARGSGIACAIVGDGSERERLERRARELAVDDRVRFLGAIYDEPSLAPLMLGAACMAIPAAIGLTLLHAFAYGLPVVTGDEPLAHGPEIEALVDGVNGLRVRDGDADALADAIARIADDAPLRSRMSAEARAVVDRPGGWNLDSMVAGMVAALTGGAAGASAAS